MNAFYKSPSLYVVFLIMTVFSFLSCKKNGPQILPTSIDIKVDTSNVAVQWAEMSLYTIRFSSSNTPTYASRSLGYLGLAMFESIVPGYPEYQSLEGQLNGLMLPKILPNQKYDWIITLNSSQSTLLKLLYPVPENSHRYVHEKIDSVNKAILHYRSKTNDKSVVDNSLKFGKDIAEAIYNWSLNDGGSMGFQRNYDPMFAFPSDLSYWIPPLVGQTISRYPLHPTWGKNRTFVSSNSNLAIPAIIPYSVNPASAYYQQYKAVYDKNKQLTQEEKEIAAWWGDDPTETASPPGHSYSLATIASKQTKASIIKAAEAYAKTGLAVADAFINCWKVKVIYFNERPSSYVRANIDSTWVQFWPEPPFPAFPSGHSIQSAAAATVLTNVFGDNFAFKDHSLEGHRRYDFPGFDGLRYQARSFKSFNEAADECAYSRFLGGIHTQQDNETGTSMGKIVGQNVVSLKWKK